VALDPPAVIIYGKSGLGKTLLMVAALERADGKTAYIAGPGGLSTGAMALGLPGISSRVVRHPRPTLSWMASAVLKLKAKGYLRIGLDDVSKAASAELVDLEVLLPSMKQIGDRYGRLKRAVQLVSDNARRVGLEIIANTHDRKGNFERKTGMWRPGGPDLEGWQVLPVIPYAFDQAFMIRKPVAATLVHAEFYAPGVHDEDWVTKDRFDVLHRFRPTGPANIREHWRAAGIATTRPKGLEWQDKVADAMVNLILGKGKTQREAWAAVAARLDGKFHPKHIRWALEDGLARASYADPVYANVLTLPPEDAAVLGGGAALDLNGDIVTGSDTGEVDGLDPSPTDTAATPGG